MKSENRGQYITASTTRKNYDISLCSLRKWTENGKIRSVRMPGGKRLFLKEDIDAIFNVIPKSKVNVCYARVSSNKQRGDLERQIESLRVDHPHHEIITDIGSGLNWKRRGLLGLLNRIQNDEIDTITITDKDRLCRFGFELIDWICGKHSTRIIVRNVSSCEGDSKELAEDLLAVANYFVARSNGRRAARNREQRKKNGQDGIVCDMP